MHHFTRDGGLVNIERRALKLVGRNGNQSNKIIHVIKYGSCATEAFVLSSIFLIVCSSFPFS